MAKRLFYVCAAILCLAAAYHLGAQKAQSAPQPSQPSNPFVSIVEAPSWGGTAYLAVTAAGDVYLTQESARSWQYLSNIKGNPGPTGY